MSASKIHAVLSEMYRLLSDYSATDFISASEYKGTPPNLRDALRALARECDHRPQRESQERTSRRPAGRKRAMDRQETNGRAILGAILHSERFKTARSITDFAEELGLSVAARPKDGRDRLARRLAQAISAQPEPTRSEIVAGLSRGADQTQGWIDVIKSARL